MSDDEIAVRLYAAARNISEDKARADLTLWPRIPTFIADRLLAAYKSIQAETASTI